MERWTRLRPSRGTGRSRVPTRTAWACSPDAARPVVCVPGLTTLTLPYFGGPFDGLVVSWLCIDAYGIWLVGGVYRYSPEREAYVWREMRA